MKEIFFISNVLKLQSQILKKVLWKRYRSDLWAKCFKMFIEWMNVSRLIYLFLDSATSPDFPFSVFPVSWRAPSSPLLPLLAIQTSSSSLAPSLFHHIQSITIFFWFYLLNSSHSYSSSGCFHACLLSPQHLPSWRSAFNSLLSPNSFSKIVAKVISKRQI